MAAAPEGGDPSVLIGAMRRPQSFVAAALRLDWFPEGSGIIRELIQLIASYACVLCM